MAFFLFTGLPEQGTVACRFLFYAIGNGRRGVAVPGYGASCRRFGIGNRLVRCCMRFHRLSQGTADGLMDEMMDRAAVAETDFDFGRMDVDVYK